MSLLYPHTVEITNVTNNPNFRSETDGVPFSSEAYIEDESAIDLDNYGQPMNDEVNIFLPNGTVISRGDYIKITAMNGSVGFISVRRKVKKIFSVTGAFSIDHLEVTI